MFRYASYAVIVIVFVAPAICAEPPVILSELAVAGDTDIVNVSPL